MAFAVPLLFLYWSEGVTTDIYITYYFILINSSLSSTCGYVETLISGMSCLHRWCLTHTWADIWAIQEYLLSPCILGQIGYNLGNAGFSLISLIVCG